MGCLVGVRSLVAQCVFIGAGGGMHSCGNSHDAIGLPR